MTPHATPALSRAQLKTLALASRGAAREFYDFVIFVFFAATMGLAQTVLSSTTP